MDRECFSIGIDDAQPRHLNQLFYAVTLFLYTAKKNLHCSLVAMQLDFGTYVYTHEIRAIAGNTIIFTHGNYLKEAAGLFRLLKALD